MNNPLDNDIDKFIVNSEELEEYNTGIKKISTKEVINIIKIRRPLGIFYSDEGKKYLAIDNRMGYALVEELDTMQECMSWLMYGNCQEE